MAECTIYDKLRYIAETKDLIKAAIEAQDVEVLESATFRQYAEYITQIRKVSSVNGMQGDVVITAKDLGALTEIPSEYITETELNEKGYLTAVPDVYITEDELSSQLADKVSQNGLNEAIEGVRNDIPTNVSQLTNDSGYITLNEVPKVDLSGYALKSEIPDISVKQDKLTAGNGISITDNVISLDYEYDLFEVVPSLPTENINDNKIYLVYQSDGEGNNLYIEYIYASGHWEELGKFKANVDLSGYATEEWVNSQGFLKEHQDISNLATKAELNTKQDVINDLETIRSGAAKGATALQSVPSGYATEEWVNGQGFLKEHQDISNLATKEELNAKQDVISDLDTIRSGAAKGSTALQSVPSTYALKTDILSAKTDTRYTTYDVQNPVLSGNTIVLQNEVTDSRKYHTLGYDKIATTIGFGNLTKRVVMNSDGSVTSDFDDYTNIPIDFSNITDDGDVIIINYVGTYANHNDDGTTFEGDAFNEYITYNKQTKILKYSERQPSFAFAQFSRSDNGENVLFPNSTEYDCSQLPEDAHLIWNIYVSSGFFYTYTAETKGNLFVGETTVNENTSSMPERKNEYFRYENNVKAYILTDKNTTFKTINGEQITGNGDITIDTNVDLSSYATKSELNEKQDVISDLETIRSGAAKGATALQSVPSGYATEQWVNEQGFLKEHQDISNLATKEELNAKQDVIPDLEAIRSGASKGATALQSVPEEYAKKTDIPDISTKQDVIPDLEAIRSGAEKGATALQSVPSGYATEQWVSEQGFLKEHQDISNLATKTELETKQDVISDLETIRSGAALGATALQEVPDTYAKKTDIPDLAPYATKEELNTKQDTITDLETIRSGAALGSTALQSVPSEYAKKTDIPDISTKQDVIPDLEAIRSGALKGETALQSVPDTYALKTDIPDITKKQDTLVSGTNIKTVNGTSLLGSGNIEISSNVDLSDYATKSELATKQDVISDLDTIRSGASLGSTALQSVPSGYATEQWVNEQGFLKEHQDISNLATKSELNAKQDVISDLETIRSGAALGSTALQSVPSEYVTETELNNKGYLTSVPDTYALKSEIPDISVKQDTLVSGTNIKTINGNSLLGSGDITIEGGSGNVDLSDYYTKTETNALVNPKLQQVTLTQAEYDALQTKEENVLYIISDAEDLKFKTINGQQITGEGNIEIDASADNVPTVQTTVQGTTSNYIYSNVSHSNNKYGVVTEISNFITYSTDKATIATYTRYWGQESSNSYQNWSINAATTSQAGLMSSSDKTKLDSIDLTPYATKEELNAKQDTLVSGTNIKTVNGTSLLGSGNIEVAKEWIGTQAQYDALPTKDNNTTYYITE